MQVCLSSANHALLSIFKNPSQIITLDANFLIPPDRSRLDKNLKAFEFEFFRETWLDPIFRTFPSLAIHEAVYGELVSSCLKAYVDPLICSMPPQLIIHKDSTLTPIELALRDSIESKIFPFTKYDPLCNNKSDRGEVKSLSYIAVKGLLYFAAHDSIAIQLIEKAAVWGTFLDNIQAIKYYELIYYLYYKNIFDKKGLRILYKYQYRCTQREKLTNPEWEEFIQTMKSIYQPFN